MENLQNPVHGDPHAAGKDVPLSPTPSHGPRLLNHGKHSMVLIVLRDNITGT